jgi:glycosyltransferase involved in cell wall biosynthesis
MYGACDESLLSPAIRNRCRHVAIDGQDAQPAFADWQFDAVHVFRLSMFGVAQRYRARVAARPVECHLDLDDVEWATHRQLAQLARENGESARESEYERLAERYTALEQIARRLVDRVYVCSEEDRVLLERSGWATVTLLPNVVDPPVSDPTPSEGPFRMVFVGTLSYYPNEDGVLWFLREVLPGVRRAARVPFEVEIVGHGANPRLREAAAAAGVILTGGVPSVAPVYARAAAAIVPVRAGGGTRIKVLEAFAHQRVVVSTRAGCAGIDVVDGTHALIGDGPDHFARQLIRLMDNPELRERLTANAFELVTTSYSPARLDRIVSRLFEP